MKVLLTFLSSNCFWRKLHKRDKINREWIADSIAINKTPVVRELMVAQRMIISCHLSENNCCSAWTYYLGRSQASKMHSHYHLSVAITRYGALCLGHFSMDDNFVNNRMGMHLNI